ncbi:hypothetical protein NL676_028438 [Syzygium grande]|nr:hypothetical protein NL676_028438 [Syzygium grande]
MGKEYEYEDDPKTTKGRITRRPPHNYVAILKDADEPIDCSSKEKVCEQLYDGVLLDNKKKKYWVDRESNKNCFMVLARDLAIAWGGNKDNWEWIPSQETSDMEVEVAVLREVCWLEVSGKFRTIALAPMTKYEIAFVVTRRDPYYRCDAPVTFTVTLPNGNKEECVKSLRRVPQQRWEHIPICEFVMLPENVGEVTFALNEHSGTGNRDLLSKVLAFESRQPLSATWHQSHLLCLCPSLTVCVWWGRGAVLRLPYPGEGQATSIGGWELALPPSIGPERRPMDQIVSKLRNFWNDWDLRLMVLLSLSLQVLLIVLGGRRKFTRKLSIRIAVWCAYISADSIAGIALGILSSKLGDFNKESGSLDANSKLIAFWAPALLLLLGGPDTITAYSLEDNELWLRHLLGLIVQTAVTIYIYFMAWALSYLSGLAFLMIVAGLIKFGERVWVLWLASSDKLKESMLDPPDPSPNYPRFMEEYTLKQAEGFLVTADEIVEVQVPEDLSANKSRPGGDEELVQAHRLLKIFKRLFVDLILSYDDKDASLSVFKDRSCKSVFEIVEIELGFMYDLLHTKAMVLYTRWASYRRIITLSIICFVLACFIWANFSFGKKPHYPSIDLALTFILLVLVILLELYSIVLLVSSDWTDVWLSKCDSSILRVVKPLQLFKQPRWSNSMGQFSLLNFCLREKILPCHKFLKLIHIHEKLEKYHYTDYEELPDSMKDFIHGNLQEKFHKSNQQKYDHKRFCTLVLTGYGRPGLTWSTELEFDECILIWHVATELCYYSDGLDEESCPGFLQSRQLSRYMFYLLVMYPFMLPSGIGQIRLRDTFAETAKFFKEKLLLSPKKRGHCPCCGDTCNKISHLFRRNPEASVENEACQKACRMLLEVNTEVPPAKVKGGRSKSVLFDGCRLALGLNEKYDISQRDRQIENARRCPPGV